MVNFFNSKKGLQSYFLVRINDCAQRLVIGDWDFLKNENENGTSTFSIKNVIEFQHTLKKVYAPSWAAFKTMQFLISPNSTNLSKSEFSSIKKKKIKKPIKRQRRYETILLCPIHDPRFQCNMHWNNSSRCHNEC